jgi:alpha-ketoglutarate-dependent taurine dioxygenase
MKYHMHENGWTVILDDFDITSCTQEDVNLLAKLLAKYTLVVARKQFATVEQEVRFMNMFHNPKPLFKPTDPEFAAHCVDPFGADPTGILMRVTGKLAQNGSSTGFAGHDEELAWHSNVPWDPERSPIVYLRGIEGTKGSVTEWNNTILAYRDLPQNVKDQIATLKTIPLTDVSLELSLQGEDMGREAEDQPPFDLVHTNIAGQTGLYFPFLQISRFDGMTREESKPLMNMLTQQVLDPKYCYSHEWEDGDFVFAEQWLGIHRRLAFDKMQFRILHRAGLDFPMQDYKDIE